MPEPSPIEEDLIEFLAQQRGEAPEKIRSLFQHLKGRFDFKSVGFRDLTEKVQVLHSLFFGVEKESDLIQTYRFHGYLAILRHLSYGEPPRLAHRMGEALYFLKLLLRGEGRRAFCSLRRQRQKKRQGEGAADFIARLQTAFPAPLVVDYGCGLAYLSQRIGREVPGSRIVLVDVAGVMNEFTQFRFRRLGIDFQSIQVTAENFYPELPPHQACIADEVAEHLPDPLAMLAGIRRAMVPDGLLYGDYGDHCPEHFHLHTDLAFFRRELERDFERLGPKLYRKR